MREIVCLSLHPDTIRRLDRVAAHLGMSRSATADQYLHVRLPPATATLPPRSELVDRIDGNRRRSHTATA